MSPHRDKDLRPMPEQVLYANILSMGALLGILIMFVTYLLYVLGVMEPHVPLHVVPANWGKPLADYQHITNSPHGWGWVSLLNTGDFLNFVGLVLLAVMTIICYLVLVPGYIRRKDWAYCAICIAEVLVLTLAASGLLGSGGH